VSNGRKLSLLILIYPGKETADEVYQMLRDLEKQDQIDIKTAATLYHAEGNKLQLKHRQRLTLWKDEFDVETIGLILAGTKAGKLSQALVGTLMGSQTPKHQCEARAFLDDNLNPDDSALIILVADADWEAVQSEVDQFGGKELALELTDKAIKQLAEISADVGVIAVIKEYVEIEEVTL
jgi:uncharacterized membrane protein